jgi:hypothetical protein
LWEGIRKIDYRKTYALRVVYRQTLLETPGWSDVYLSFKPSSARWGRFGSSLIDYGLIGHEWFRQLPSFIMIQVGSHIVMDYEPIGGLKDPNTVMQN